VTQLRWEAENAVSLVLVAGDGGVLSAWGPGAHLEITLPSGRIRDHCEDLVVERTRVINRLHWHLHDLEISLAAGQALNRIGTLNRLREQIGQHAGGVRAEIAAELIERIITLTRRSASSSGASKPRAGR
jgi:hypothetical protein